jgi:hypothetical protein
MMGRLKNLFTRSFKPGSLAGFTFDQRGPLAAARMRTRRNDQA